jgi:hypothetical protein
MAIPTLLVGGDRDLISSRSDGGSFKPLSMASHKPSPDTRSFPKPACLFSVAPSLCHWITHHMARHLLFPHCWSCPLGVSVPGVLSHSRSAGYLAHCVLQALPGGSMGGHGLSRVPSTYGFASLPVYYHANGLITNLDCPGTLTVWLSLQTGKTASGASQYNTI